MANLNLIQVHQDGKDDYNQFVASSQAGSFLQSWDWGEWQMQLGRAVFRFKTQNSSGVIVGVLQLIKMPLPFSKFYLYAPYGPVTDLACLPAGRDGRIEDLRFLTQELQKKFPEAIFVRVEPKNSEIIQSVNYSICKSANVQPGKTLIINLSQTEEELLSQMHPKTRYNIRLAEKHGLVVRSDLAVTPGHGFYFQEAINQIAETETRQGFKGHGVAYYKNLVDFFSLEHQEKLKVNIYKVLLGQELLASAIMIDFGKVRTYLFGGSSEKSKNLMAPYLLHFQAIKDAKNSGLLCYDFWGIETSAGKTPGFARFKLGFGGGVLEYGGAWDVPLRRKMYRLYQVAKKLRI